MTPITWMQDVSVKYIRIWSFKENESEIPLILNSSFTRQMKFQNPTSFLKTKSLRAAQTTRVYTYPSQVTTGDDNLNVIHYIHVNCRYFNLACSLSLYLSLVLFWFSIRGKQHFPSSNYRLVWRIRLCWLYVWSPWFIYILYFLLNSFKLRYLLWQCKCCVIDWSFLTLIFSF